MSSNKYSFLKKDGEYVLLMTACINPKIEKLHRTDPEIRIKDYQDALKFWLSCSDYRLDKIVFVENSGYDLCSIRELIDSHNIYDKEVEIIQTNSNFIPDGIHYGYAELAMVDYVVENSALMQHSQYFIKVTGRLVFKQLSDLLNRNPDDFLFSVDFRENTLFVKQPQRFVTTQLMIFDISFYKENFLNIKDELNQQRRLIENLFYEKLIDYKNDKNCILRWPINVDPTGYAGHWNKNYNAIKPRLLSNIRSLCRTFFPSWWV